MPKHALIVDPSSERFAVYRDIFCDEDMAVEWAHNGLAACEYVQARADIGFVVTELSLPGIDGFQVLRTFSRTSNAGAPVLVASAFQAMRDTAIALRKELGISYVLPAASAPLLVRDVIHRLLRHESATAETPVWTASRAQESRRLRSLAAVGAAQPNTQLDDALRTIVERVASALKVPVAAVSLVLENKQWFRVRTGMELEETPLEASFCRHVVQANELLIVPDATVHPTFARNSLVRHEIVRGYAGAPLVGSDGEVWGALCVIDPAKPLALSAVDIEKLLAIAKLVASELEAHARSAPPAAPP